VGIVDCYSALLVLAYGMLLSLGFLLAEIVVRPVAYYHILSQQTSDNILILPSPNFLGLECGGFPKRFPTKFSTYFSLPNPSYTRYPPIVLPHIFHFVANYW
jgi:hypothetical protein